jgi:16S rRNA (cytosine1402-N4)-methyltransferase
METAHVPVLAREAVAALAIKPDGIYVDAMRARWPSRLILAQRGRRAADCAGSRSRPGSARCGLQDARLTLVQSAFSVWARY